VNDTKKTYDIIITGGGPAGLSAGLYTARSSLSSLLIERGAVGGQIVNTEWIENYPGAKGNISGLELTQIMYEQATGFGLETTYADVNAVAVDGDMRIVKTSSGDYTARAIIIAGGSERQKMGVPGEAEYTGKGVSYCAVCDGAFFREKDVAVVGGGNAALTEAIEMTRFASRVTLIHRRDEFRGMKVLQDRAAESGKIDFLMDSVVDEVLGDNFVTGLKVSNVKTKQQKTLPVSGVFISIGFKPNTAYLKGTVELDETGAVVTDKYMATSVPGIYAAGDIRSGSIRQVIAAAGDGAVAAVNADRYLHG
jgi:thioredoxin reductase (NADPH)